MARFKGYDYAQDEFISVNYRDQLLPGSLEYAIRYLIDERIGLERFEGFYKNEAMGPKAYDPRLLLKIILFAYSQGLTTSRKMEWACKHNVIFMALGCGIKPDHSTFSLFIDKLRDVAQEIFEEVLLACDEEGLLGYTHFSLDGVKLPSNASREWSGKHAELLRKREKLEHKIKEKILEHRRADCGTESDDTRHAQQIERLAKHAVKIEAFMAEHPPRMGEQGKEVSSNVTDPESCLMKTRHGMVQGYNAQALVDSENQVIVSAGVEATGHDQKLAQRALNEAAKNLEKSSKGKDALKGAKLTADCQYHSEENLQAAQDHGMDAYIPDNRFRQRDPAFEGQDRHKPKTQKRYDLDDFVHDEVRDTYVCPHGRELRLRMRKGRKENRLYRVYISSKSDCADCPLKPHCLPDKRRKCRSLSVPIGKTEPTLRNLMRERIDLPESRKIYAQRMHIVEPVFGNIRHNKGMNRFTLRGQSKVNAQWLLFCCVHNIEKWGKKALFWHIYALIGSLKALFALLGLYERPKCDLSAC